MPLALQVGRTYRAKNPGYAKGFVNDRTVLWVDAVKQRVQYDGPAVNFGRTLPVISLEQFRTWAKHDITDQLPAGEYQQWGEYLVQLQTRRKELKGCQAKRTKRPAKLTVEKTPSCGKPTGTASPRMKNCGSSTVAPGSQGNNAGE